MLITKFVLTFKFCHENWKGWVVDSDHLFIMQYRHTAPLHSDVIRIDILKEHVHKMVMGLTIDVGYRVTEWAVFAVQTLHVPQANIHNSQKSRRFPTPTMPFCACGAKRHWTGKNGQNGENWWQNGDFVRHFRHGENREKKNKWPARFARISHLQGHGGRKHF